MVIPTKAQDCFLKGLLLSASVLVLWMPQSSWAALYIQKIPEQPQKNQDLLLSVLGVPETFQDFNWYLGEETSGGTMLFTYFPEQLRPQRDGSAMGNRDITGFPNGSMLLRRAQPTDSGTYHVAVTINPAWTMRARTEVQVAEKHVLPIIHLPVNAKIVAAITIGSLVAGSLLVGSITYFLVTRCWKGQSHRMTPTEKPELGPPHSTDDENLYEVMPSPVLLVSPLSDTGSTTAAMPPPLPPPLQPEEQQQHYQDLLNPDPAPYCQLVPTS